MHRESSTSTSVKFGMARDFGLIEASKQYQNKPIRTFPAMLAILQMDRIYLRGLDVNSITLLTYVNWPVKENRFNSSM